MNEFAEWLLFGPLTFQIFITYVSALMLEVSAFTLLGVSPIVIGTLVTGVSLIVPALANFTGARTYFKELTNSQRDDKDALKLLNAVHFRDEDFSNALRIHESRLV